MKTVNGYTVMEKGDPAPWGNYDDANFTLLFNMMPTNGTYLVDGVTVPNPHKHSILFDATETERARVTATGFGIGYATPQTSLDVRKTNGGGVPALNATNVALFANTDPGKDCGISLICRQDSVDRISFGTHATAQLAYMQFDTLNSIYYFYNGGSPVLTMSQTYTYFNSAGDDVDFRIKGDNDANLFFCEATGAAAENRVCIGTMDRLGGVKGYYPKLHILSGGGVDYPQLALSYDNNYDGSTGHHATFKVDSSGNMFVDAWSSGCIGEDILFSTVVGTLGGRHGFCQETPAATVHVTQPKSDAAIPCLELDQDNTAEQFIEFDGATAADATKSISTRGIAPVAANGPVVANWTLAGMIRISVNGADKWIPYYTAI